MGTSAAMCFEGGWPCWAGRPAGLWRLARRGGAHMGTERLIFLLQILLLDGGLPTGWCLQAPVLMWAFAVRSLGSDLSEEGGAYRPLAQNCLGTALLSRNCMGASSLAGARKS